MARRSTTLLALSVGMPCTCERKPSSAYLFRLDEAPSRFSRSEGTTSLALLPIVMNTIPIPVSLRARSGRGQLLGAISWGSRSRSALAEVSMLAL